MNRFLWIFWLLGCAGLGTYLVLPLLSEQDKSVYLIGEASHGHYQIELACESCHTSPFGGKEVLQNACLQCHAEELDEANDSHPKSKFTDPREAYRLETIDARYCVSCHVEHQQENTHAMGVTLPDDYCYHCHQETIEERKSHQNLAFDSCASAGCHNYHDNRALYESFLLANAGQPWLSENPHLAANNYAEHKAATVSDNPSPERQPKAPDDWHGSSHQLAGIGCNACHSSAANSSSTFSSSTKAVELDSESTWVESPGPAQCSQCHRTEYQGFRAGKHGMRLAINDAANQHSTELISPSEAIRDNSPLSFKNSSHGASQGCNACHGAHSYDTKPAAVDACLSCHNDEHSLAYEASPHGVARKIALEQALSLDTTVSCASCHMPIISAGNIEKQSGTLDAKQVSEGVATSHITLWRVQHNQNWNLRPNEKMIRSVCMSCHSLEFSIDALADPALIKNNFNGEPALHIESIDWAVARDQ